MIIKPALGSLGIGIGDAPFNFRIKINKMKSETISQEYTKNNPGCYHSALRYLSELTGISARKEIIINKMSGLRNKSGKQLSYRAWDIQVVDKDGNKFSYMQDGQKRFDQAGIIADRFLVIVNRSLEEFGVEIKNEGNYKDSLGGGWSQTVPLYSINGNFFADMDCAH